MSVASYIGIYYLTCKIMEFEISHDKTCWIKWITIKRGLTYTIIIVKQKQSNGWEIVLLSTCFLIRQLTIHKINTKYV